MDELQRGLRQRRGLQDRREENPGSFISDIRLLAERAIGINSSRPACLHIRDIRIPISFALVHRNLPFKSEII